MCRRMLMHVNVVLRVVLVSTLSCCSMKSAVQIKFWFDLRWSWQRDSPGLLTAIIHPLIPLPPLSLTRWQLPCAPPPPLLCLVPSLGPGSMRLSTPIPFAERLTASQQLWFFPFRFLIPAFDFSNIFGNVSRSKLLSQHFSLNDVRPLTCIHGCSCLKVPLCRWQKRNFHRALGMSSSFHTNGRRFLFFFHDYTVHYHRQEQKAVDLPTPKGTWAYQLIPQLTKDIDWTEEKSKSTLWPWRLKQHQFSLHTLFKGTRLVGCSKHLGELTTDLLRMDVDQRFLQTLIILLLSSPLETKLPSATAMYFKFWLDSSRAAATF